MTQGDGAAVGIQLLIHVDSQILAHSHGLGSKCLICLNDVKIFDLHACLGQDFPGGCHRADSHNFGTDACQRAGNKGCHRLHAQFLCLLLAHDNDGCRSVIDAGGIACCHETIFIDGAQFCKTFDGRTGTGAFIYFKFNGFLLFLHHHRNDLRVKGT